VFCINAMEAAAQMSNSKVFNMLVLGGLLKARPQLATVEDVVSGLKKTLPERHHNLLPMNEEAIRKGMDLIKEV
jgi:2-oxoglutarate ferredoxin oxidoreductase subunit gamma